MPPLLSIELLASATVSVTLRTETLVGQVGTKPGVATFAISFSNSNSGEWTPITTNP
jgi:hypothetical protein